MSAGIRTDAGAAAHERNNCGACALGGCGGHGYMGAAPSVSFPSPAQASSIHLGQTVALNWTSAYTTACSAGTSSEMGGNFGGSQPTSGSATVAPAAAGSYTYSLSCTGPGGTMMATSAAVTVGPAILSQLKSVTTIGSTIDPSASADAHHPHDRRRCPRLAERRAAPPACWPAEPESPGPYRLPEQAMAQRREKCWRCSFKDAASCVKNRGLPGTLQYKASASRA